MKKSADLIRSTVWNNHIEPNLKSGKQRFSVAVRDVLEDLSKRDFPSGRTPLVCAVLQGKKFLSTNGLEIESVEGPPSKQSPTVVVHYRVQQPKATTGTTEKRIENDKALRALDYLTGLLKEELAEYGGGEAFLRWVRSENEDAA